MTGWPLLLALDLGETAEIAVGGARHSIGLVELAHTWMPDYWIADNPARRTLRSATVALKVDGQDVVLSHRPYELPTRVGDLQLYVETTRPWATMCNLEEIALDKDLRLSIGLAGQPWGPELLRFPIAAYRWRSSSYNNTWSAVVPYNLLYYHRGEDFGAIPDRLPVIAALEGVTTASPVPAVRGSNVVAIRSPLGLTVRYAHMNIETIDPALTVGTRVSLGQVLGRTGCTWDGSRSQWADPHLHVGFAYETAVGDVPISPYPFLVDAYLRDYDDPILPVAGGYHFTTVGTTVKLDADRTIVRRGRGHASYIWQCHDGRRVPGPQVEVAYDAPGQYAETLIVRTVDGAEARDTAHVRVYDPALAPQTARQALAHGWVYATPVRGLHAGSPVTVWNRLVRTEGEVTIDYGDGTPLERIDRERTHVYGDAGIYTVTVAGRGTWGEPVTAQLSVVVS